MYAMLFIYVFFFFNDTATTEIYTLSLHDALPIYSRRTEDHGCQAVRVCLYDILLKSWGLQLHISLRDRVALPQPLDRKSTRLNSSHSQISYAVFCLKKQNNKNLILLDRSNH